MTVLDKSVENVKGIMILPRKEFSCDIPLKEGYSYGAYTDEMFEEWCELHAETGLFVSMEEAREKLTSMLAEDRNAFEKQFLFVLDKNKHLVGSCGLWKGKHFGMDRLRLHYVSVREKNQHQGIGKAMIVRLAKMYDETPSKYPLYVVTQSQSHGAIKLYSRLGFTPYLGEYKDCTKKQSEHNWEVITKILKEKTE